MGVLTGLAAFQQAEDEQGSKVKWLKLADGQSVKIHFLDDLDGSSSECDHGAGIAVVIPEHKAPSNYMTKMQCTRPDACWACDKAIANKKQGWGRTNRFYINVLVDDGTQEPYVAVWSQGTARSAAFDQLKEDFIDNGQIANRWYRLKRTGSTVNDTKYLLRALEADSEPFNYGDYERYDLAGLVKEVPYADQAAYLAAPPEEVAEASDSDWI